MPAPAVIPATKAYINAVAVKGFVVELRVAQDWRVVLRGPAACNSRTFETSNTGVNFPPNTACNVRRRAPVIFTVIKKA